MKNKPDFMIIGGDCRFSYIKDQLINEGYNVKRIYPGEYRADDFTDCDVFILPVPVSRDNININTPLAGEQFYFGDFLRLIPENSVVAGGMFNDEHLNKLRAKNITVFDYYKDDELAIKNAVPTAEGVLAILINSLPVTIDGLECAVTGYGRCAKVLCKKLKDLGADVTVAARSEENLTAAEKDGMKICRLRDLGSICNRFSAIVNTVPALVIDSESIKNLKKNCLIIEIASAPFGVDFDARVTGVSAIPDDSFASVFPVQGAMTRASIMFLGPMGSAPVIVCIISLPQIFSILSLKLSAVPKRVSVLYALKDIIGTISVPEFFSSSIYGITLSNVQNDPHKAKPSLSAIFTTPTE